jgi:cyclase
LIMLQTRIIPVLLLRNESLVKTINFNHFTYVGDPCNTVRIFNELEVDELIFLDITASKKNRGPNYKILNDISNECFMPLGYGGGIRSIEDAKKIFDIGFEKISLNTSGVENPNIITEIANHYGNQAIIASIDVKENIWGKPVVWTKSGSDNKGLNPIDWAKEVERRGAGEILMTSIQREGTWTGFDLELISEITHAVNIPVIAHGGAGSIRDIGEVVNKSGASAVAIGSMVVYQKQGMGVLVNFPDKIQIKSVLE